MSKPKSSVRSDNRELELPLTPRVDPPNRQTSHPLQAGYPQPASGLRRPAKFRRADQPLASAAIPVHDCRTELILLWFAHDFTFLPNRVPRASRPRVASFPELIITFSCIGCVSGLINFGFRVHSRPSRMIQRSGRDFLLTSSAARRASSSRNSR